MSIFSRKKPQRREVAIVNDMMLGEAIRNGYTTLDHCPEVVAACMRIADLISSMTIYLMANTENGDKRINNELSRKVDILPTEYMTRKTWMDAIVMNLLLYGKGNSVVVPHTQNGLIGDLEPIAASRVYIRPIDYRNYRIEIDGKAHDPSECLHFVFNPDKSYLYRGQGIQVAARQLVENLGQAAATEKSFMESKWKPSVIVKVDALTDEFASPEGRQKLVEEYLHTNEIGQPWIIPSEQFSVQEIRPLSLNDLAIADTVKLDKKMVAALLGVPAFVLGVGEFNANEWNAFISNTIRPIAQGIEQELTKKLLLSPKMYFKFNTSSLYAYDLKTTVDVYCALGDRGYVSGNEVRDKMSMEPREGLDELRVLENYIPVDKSGMQKKLKGESNE